jgi:hypothetical protein
MRWSRGAIVLALAALGTSARAQDLPSVEVARIDLSPYVRPGTPIRISGAALRRVGGYVVGIHADTILLGSDRNAGAGGARAIRLGAVDTLWTKGHWFWPGVAIGISAGVLVGGAICVFGQEEDCTQLPIGAASGVALGAIVGSLRKLWHPRFVRRDGGPQPVFGN